MSSLVLRLSLDHVELNPARQECYDDAMNAADEHGVIHPERSARALDGRVQLSSRSSIDRYAAPSPGASPKGARTTSEENTVDQCQASKAEESTGGKRGSSCRGQRTPHSRLLGVLRELCEVARLDIAASAVVGGACKVG